MPNKSNQRIYLKTLAIESGESNVSFYIKDMQEFDDYLFEHYRFKIKDLKGRRLKAYQVEILEKLNPTSFHINTMKEMGEYEKWLQWFLEVKKFALKNEETEKE